MMKAAIAIVGEDDPYFCSFHPRHVAVGVCASCLKERLLILASVQSHGAPAIKSSRGKDGGGVGIPKLGSFLHRLNSRRRRNSQDDGRGGDDDDDSLDSLDDSFISIKFEDNGRAQWDKKAAAAGGGDDGIKMAVDQAKQRGILRWRRQIGRLLQMARWKRPAGTAVAADGSKGRRGWMRSFTRRKSMHA